VEGVQGTSMHTGTASDGSCDNDVQGTKDNVSVNENVVSDDAHVGGGTEGILGDLQTVEASGAQGSGRGTGE
jgi:hypothetical protein